MGDFEIRETVRYELFLPDGTQVVDENGHPKLYDSRDAAEFAASTWDMQRAPSWGELQAMTDDELRFRGGL